MQTQYDLKTGMLSDVSLRPGTTISGGTGANGISVDLRDTVGPVQAICIHGLITGTPTSFSHTFQLEESSDESSWTAMNPRQQANISALDDPAIAKGTRTKRFARVVVTDNFTGGTSPTSEVCAVIFAQKVHSDS